MHKTWIFLFGAVVFGIANGASFIPDSLENNIHLNRGPFGLAREQDYQDIWDVYDDYGQNYEDIEQDTYEIKDKKETVETPKDIHQVEPVEDIDGNDKQNKETLSVNTTQIAQTTQSLSDDYQVEDNRMELKEPLAEHSESSEAIGSIDIADNDEDKEIIEETKAILSEDDGEDGKIDSEGENVAEKLPELEDDKLSEEIQSFKDNRGQLDTDDYDVPEKTVERNQTETKIEFDSSNEDDAALRNNEDNLDVDEASPEESNDDDNQEENDDTDDNDNQEENDNTDDNDNQEGNDDTDDNDNQEENDDTDDTDKEIKVPVLIEAQVQSIEDDSDDTEGNPQSSEDIQEALDEDDDDDDGEDEDTVNKVLDDLKDDMEQLSKTIDKLTSDNSNSEQKDDDIKTEVNPEDTADELDEKEEIADEDVLGYEEKHGKPFREDNILSLRDYENVDDSNLGILFSERGEEDVNGDTDYDYADDEPKDVDSDMFNINAAWVIDGNESTENNNSEDSEKEENVEEPIESSVESEEAAEVELEKVEDNIDEPSSKEFDPDMFNINGDESESTEDIDSPAETESKVTETTSTTSQPISEEDTEESAAVKSIDVSNLTADQYNDLMDQFQDVHKDEVDTQSEDFSTHIAPIHMSLSVDTPLEVTSPNYPNNYPTNNIVDWIFDGKGKGIELNITDFAINGVLGDYLLVKPGGADETGHKGLIFSYQLKEERRYRFLDVDQMFVRFESKPGLAFNRGFKFSVKMIAPLPEELEPEPLLPSPPATLTVNLGGLNISEFLTDPIREELRQLIADMATLYINSNNISPGLNNTSDVTQITSVSVCNVNWPNYENCAAVTFGVPVVYEDEETGRLNEQDLRSMWYTYIYQDPFAFRLNRLGVTEFSEPNDEKTMQIWLVIAGGVVISAAMLAFALWRYSCIENYTRMSTYSDSDSIVNSKRGLDLYPTPHQTLPPLFSDNDLKWDDKYDNSARVDMSGYNNSNYVRDELYDLESDEEVVAPRDRYTTDV